MNSAGSGGARRRPLSASGTSRLSELVPEHRRAIAAFGVWVLVLASVVSWRRGAIYSGGIDSTVVLKAVIAVVAAVAAVVLWRTATARRPLSAAPALVVAAIVAISLIGAVTTGTVLPNAVLAVRIVILGATALLVLAAAPTETAVVTLLAAMAAVGIVAAVTGVGSITHTGTQAGRLGGGFPALEPNELASLLLPPAIGLLYLVVRRGRRGRALLGLAVLVALIWFTGSRTALAMLVVGGLVALFTARRVRRSVVVGAVAVVVALSALIAFTPLFGQVVLRGEGIGRLLSLNSRTIAWNAVLALPKDQASWWLGHGLSMKTIAVTGQYWATQVFDSSWFSSLAQDGVLGTILLGLLVLGALVAVATNRSIRPWALPLLVTMVIRSVVENGLIESSATFALLLVIATAAWPRMPSARRIGERAEVTADAAEPEVRQVAAV